MRDITCCRGQTDGRLGYAEPFLKMLQKEQEDEHDRESRYNQNQGFLNPDGFIRRCFQMLSFLFL